MNLFQVMKLHAPKLTTVATVVTAGAAVGSAIYATHKAEEAIAFVEEKTQSKLTWKQKTKLCWKYYIPCGAFLFASVGGAVGTLMVEEGRQAVVKELYSAAVDMHEEYKAAVAEKVPEETLEAIDQRRAEIHAANAPTALIPEAGSYICRDPFGVEFTASWNDIYNAMNEVNDSINNGYGASLNDFYDYVSRDIRHTTAGDELAWEAGGGLVRMSKGFTDDKNGNPVLEFWFEPMPKWRYEHACPF